MEAKIENYNDSDSTDTLTFTLSEVNVSVANALRRIILSDIEVCGIVTTPYAENTMICHKNTTFINNEILKHRISCIPVCISDIENTRYENYIVELDIENLTDSVLMVTTEHFKIRYKDSGDYMHKNDVKVIFPPFRSPQGTEFYIEIVELRPKLSENLKAGAVHFECEISKRTARQNAVYNVVNICSYGNTVDISKRDEELDKLVSVWKSEEKNAKEIDFNSRNWKLLGGYRCFKENSFDFVIKNIGIYSNALIVAKACDVMLEKLSIFKNMLDNKTLDISPSETTTIDNSYDIRLHGEDYTLGNFLNNHVFNHYLANDLNVLTFCGFKKFHPHDETSTLRVAFKDNNKNGEDLPLLFEPILTKGMQTFSRIKGIFSK